MTKYAVYCDGVAFMTSVRLDRAQTALRLLASRGRKAELGQQEVEVP